MAFSSKRGRPRKPPAAPDFGTPELRFKHAHGLTAEPIDLCLGRGLINEEQHRSGLHLRWLHTLRYGAPCITTRYIVEDEGATATDDPAWRSLREREYAEAVQLLRAHRREEAVIPLVIFNESPLFLDRAICQQAWDKPALFSKLERQREHVQDGLMLLAEHWKTARLRQKNHSN